MNVLVDGDLYKVTFNYFENEYPYGHKKHRKHTACSIVLLPKDNSLNTYIWVGQATCAPMDQFNKEVGRKIAFSKQ
jgi:hypothetical protein